MTARQLQSRLEALTGQEHYVQFYGAWHCISESTGAATRCNDRAHAIAMAEDRNAEHEQELLDEFCRVHNC